MNHILFNKKRGVKGSSHIGILTEIGNFFNGIGKITYGPEKRFEGAYEIIVRIGIINYEFVIQDLEWDKKTIISYDRTIITGLLFFWLDWNHEKTVKNRLKDWAGNTKYGHEFKFLSEKEYLIYGKDFLNNTSNNIKSAQQSDASETMT